MCPCDRGRGGGGHNLNNTTDSSLSGCASYVSIPVGDTCQNRTRPFLPPPHTSCTIAAPVGQDEKHRFARERDRGQDMTTHDVTGGYRYLEGVFQYSGGVRAL